LPTARHPGRRGSRPTRPRPVAKIEVDADIAEAFGIEIGELVYERARVVKDGKGQPTHKLTSYYRPEDVEGTPLVDPTPGPAGRDGGFAVLTMQGLRPDSITETFYSRMPTPDELEALELTAGEPVMILHRRTKHGRVVEVARGVHVATRFAWSYTFTIPE
jgi:GntR family transcriptional regulator